MPNDTVAVIPSWIWEVDVTNDPSSAVVTWTDITQYVRDSATIKRGRQQETGRDQAGTCSVALYNGDRRFDFFNTSGPYGAGFKPMRRIRCRASWASITYPLYYGFIDGPALDYPGFADATTTVTATDAFKVLANRLVSGSFPAQRSDARVGAILDAIGWPASMRDLGAGVSVLDAATLDKVSALEHLQQVADSESGRLFIDASGNVTFVDRHAPYLTSTEAIFGEQEINYVDVSLTADDQLIYNEVIAQRAADGAEARSAVDATSQAAYLTRSLSRTGLLVDTDNEAQDAAEFSLALYKDYHPRIASVTLSGASQPNSVWPQALGRELGDRWTVRKRPPGGGLIEQESFIESITHQIGVGTWITTAQLSAIGQAYQIFPSGKGFFIVGDSTYGKIGAAGPGVLTY